MNQLKELYTKTFQQTPASIEQMKGAGSNRRYYRITAYGGKTVIGAVGTSAEENHAFVTIARHLRAKGLRVPEVYAVSYDELRYLQQDLGNRTLFDALKEGREKGGDYSEQEKELLRKVISELPRLQELGAEDFDFSVCYPQPEFDEENVMFDLNYFKYCFLKPSGVDFNEVKLQKDFKALAIKLTQSTSPHPSFGFMYRDFQARNIMLDENNDPWFIDFQGGRRGPGVYDLVSFLWQASAKYPQELREELVKLYFLHSEDKQEQANMLDLFVLFRTLQVLGAYGYRGYFERKQHFLDSIPPALENLRRLLAKTAFPYPCLVKALEALQNQQPNTASETLAQPNSPLETLAQPNSPFRGSGGLCALTVRVFSFSYKKGIPEDVSGNGGGYVFDCRSTNNPGRYKEYKTLTGLDKPVIDFLEKDGEILRFLDSVYPLVDFHVQRWLDRSFTDLQISFGCTGGQHRSVYSAQHVAEHINKKFGVQVQLCHREQNLFQILAP